MTKQGLRGRGLAVDARHLERLAPRLAAVDRYADHNRRRRRPGARRFARAGGGRPAGRRRLGGRAGARGEVGHAIRTLRDDEPPQYLVAVPADLGRVIRLAVPLGDVLVTRARMRNRLLVGAGFAFLGCLVLSSIFIRAITRPLQADDPHRREARARRLRGAAADRRRLASSACWRAR